MFELFFLCPQKLITKHQLHVFPFYSMKLAICFHYFFLAAYTSIQHITPCVMGQSGLRDGEDSSSEEELHVVSPNSIEANQQEQICPDLQSEAAAEAPLPSSSPLHFSSTPSGKSQSAIPSPLTLPALLEQCRQGLRKELQAKRQRAHLLAHHPLLAKGKDESSQDGG